MFAVVVVVPEFAVAVIQFRPSVERSMRYPVIAEPPLSDGAVHERVTVVDDGVACTDVGALGRPMAARTPVVEPSATKGKLSPISLEPSPRVVVFSYPSRPNDPRPQHLILRLSRIAQVCAFDVKNDAVRPVPRLTGGRLSPISPLASPRLLALSYPKAPLTSAPQHFTDALSRTAQVKPFPADIVTARRPVPRLTAGRLSPISPLPSPRLFVSPCPSSPKKLSPQHFNPSLSRIAHE